MIKKHLKSAAITFSVAMGFEVLPVLSEASTWSDIGWPALLAAGSFVGARAMVKAAIDFAARSAADD